MKLLDFKYRNKLLSQLGLVLCDPENRNGSNTIDGAMLTFETVKRRDERHRIMDTSYEDVLTATFGICKKACDGESMAFSMYELIDIERWLLSKKYTEFQPCDEDFDDIVFLGTFTQISYQRSGGSIVKLVVTFQTDSSYAYTKERIARFNINNANGVFHVMNNSDEIGYITPSYLELKIKQSGDLLIKNSLDEDNMLIKGCLNNETILIDNINQIIVTESSSHKIYDDFNYKFIKLFRTEDSADNEFTFSIPCSGLMKYRLVKKVPIICQ